MGGMSPSRLKRRARPRPVNRPLRRLKGTIMDGYISFPSGWDCSRQASLLKDSIEAESRPRAFTRRKSSMSRGQVRWNRMCLCCFTAMAWLGTTACGQPPKEVPFFASKLPTAARALPLAAEASPQASAVPRIVQGVSVGPTPPSAEGKRVFDETKHKVPVNEQPGLRVFDSTKLNLPWNQVPGLRRFTTDTSKSTIKFREFGAFRQFGAQSETPPGATPATGATPARGVPLPPPNQ